MSYKIPIEIVELETENYHLLVRCVFADGEEGNWVLDTGASKSVFDKNLANYFKESSEESEKLHSAGINDAPLETSIAYLSPIHFGKLKLINQKVALLDMSHINKLYKKTCDLQICGLLGSDFLLKHKAIINYKKKQLILRV